MSICTRSGWTKMSIGTWYIWTLFLETISIAKFVVLLYNRHVDIMLSKGGVMKLQKYTLKMGVFITLVVFICMVYMAGPTRATTNIQDQNKGISISYSSHLQDRGWEENFSKKDGMISGRVGEDLKIEAIKIQLENAPMNSKIRYQAHVQDIGWQGWVENGYAAGTTGKNLKVEALHIELENLPDYQVVYRSYIQGIGWTSWVSDGEMTGTTGRNLRLEAIQIKVVKKTFSIVYDAFVQNAGWQGNRNDGAISGTTGQNLKLEAFKISLIGAPVSASITYQAHVQDIGWQDWVNSNQVAGVFDKGLKIEAIKVKLIGLSSYDVRYRVHVQDIGWMDWVANGELAGTTGRNLKVEAIQVKVIPKDNVSVAYASHVQDIDWEEAFSKVDGMVSGTTGRNLKIEAMKIKLVNAPTDAKIVYRSYIQGSGWQAWVQNGEQTGTTGKNLRLEAIQIKIEGIENYSVRYRTHVQDIGWMDWVTDGETSGVVGNSLKIEAIQIEVLPSSQIKPMAKGKLNLEVPAEDTINGSTLNIEGWAMANQKNTQLEIYLDGQRIHTNITRIVRPDVISSITGFGGIGENPQPGFKTSIDIRNYSRGSHLLMIKIVNEEASTIAFLQKGLSFGRQMKKGIDVSTYQSTINWPKVKQDGVDFAMIRVGFRGYGLSGTLVEDAQFQNNIKGATNSGIQVGLYFFTQAITEQEAIEEANFVLGRIGRYPITYPIAIDTEWSSHPNQQGRADGLTKEQRTKVVKAFCETIKKAGYEPMIYANKYWLKDQLDLNQLDDYAIWLAHYTGATQDDPLAKPSDYDGKYIMWQYTDKGTVDGIIGNTDMNVGWYSLKRMKIFY